MKIDVYMTPEEAEKAGNQSGFPTLPEGDYDLRIDSAEVRESANGRPRLFLQCAVINHPEYSGRNVFYSCPLPWMVNGELDASNIWLLTNLYAGIGMTWRGAQIDTDDLIGQPFKAHIVQRPRVRYGEPVYDDAGNQIIDNSIKKIYRQG